MRDQDAHDTKNAAIERAAAAWVLRLESGLTNDEDRDLAEWTASDPRHAAVLAEHWRAWARFAPLAALAPTAPQTRESDRKRPSLRPRRRLAPLLRFGLPALAAAAAVVVGIYLRTPATAPASARPEVANATLPAACEQRVLSDGSTVVLNRAAELTMDFSRAERRVHLVRGEASFTVAKDAARPFIVVGSGVEVRAVGTAFNVRLGHERTEVLVTEGVVRVNAATARTELTLDAGQHVAIAGNSPAAAPLVTTLLPAEIERELAWQPRMLDFDNVALAEIVTAFNLRNPVPMVVADPVLAAVRLTASFRSDHVASFVRLIESNYGVHVESRGDALVLRRE